MRGRSRRGACARRSRSAEGQGSAQGNSRDEMMHESLGQAAAFCSPLAPLCALLTICTGPCAIAPREPPGVGRRGDDTRRSSALDTALGVRLVVLAGEIESAGKLHSENA